MLFKRQLPIYRARTTCLCFQYLLVAVTGCPQMHFGLADLLAPCKCHKLNFRVVEGVSPEGCCQIPGTDPASTGPTQAAVCFFLKSMAVKGNSQQGAGCRNHSTSKRCQLLCTFFFPMSSSHTLPCMVAYWHHHHGVGAVSLVVHEGGVCGINPTAVVLVACRNGAKWCHPDVREIRPSTELCSLLGSDRVRVRREY